MEDLKTWYRQNLVSRTAELGAALRQEQKGAGEGLEALRRLAHSLRGSGGTYGFPQISQAAAAVEDAPAAQIGPAVEVLLGVLREVVGTAGPRGAVLVIEDNPELRHLLSVRLEAEGRKVLIAADAAQAEARLADGGIAAVVLDLILPDADGRSLLRRLSQQPATAGIPVLVMTTLATETIRKECLDLGAAGFFVKPFDAERIVAAVAEVLEGGQRTAPVAATRQPDTILVVEDDHLVASLLSHRLGREGFEVLHFPEATAALEAIRGRTLSLAILDVKMPGMDGFQLLTQLRQQPEWARTPIVMLSAMGKEEHVVRGLSLGADDYILKPFSPTELIARVRRLLQLSGRSSA